MKNTFKKMILAGALTLVVPVVATGLATAHSTLQDTPVIPHSTLYDYPNSIADGVYFGDGLQIYDEEGSPSGYIQQYKVDGEDCTITGDYTISGKDLTINEENYTIRKVFIVDLCDEGAGDIIIENKHTGLKKVIRGVPYSRLSAVPNQDWIFQG